MPASFIQISARRFEIDTLWAPLFRNRGGDMMAPFYEQANVEVSGKTPGTTIERVGGSFACGIAMLDKAENKEAAEAFMKYLFDPEGGLAVLQGAAALCSRARAKLRNAQALPVSSRRSVAAEQ